MSSVRRVSVVGSNAAGETTFGRALVGRLGVPFTELDAVQHLADWTPIERSEFVRQIAEVAAHDAWVVDGNDSVVVRDGPVWERADTVVWLDVSKSAALW